MRSVDGDPSRVKYGMWNLKATVNIGLAKIEISLEEGDRPTLNDEVEDEQANVSDR